MRDFLLLVAVSCLILLFAALGFFAFPVVYFVVLEPCYPVLNEVGRFTGLIDLLAFSNTVAGAYIGYVIAHLLLRKMKVVDEMPTKFLRRLFPTRE
jgi:hypothetical protein